MPRRSVQQRRDRTAEDQAEVARIKKQVSELESIMQFAFARSAKPSKKQKMTSLSSSSSAPGSASSSSPTAGSTRRRDVVSAYAGGGGRQSMLLSSGESFNHLPPQVEREVQLPSIMLSQRTMAASAILASAPTQHAIPSGRTTVFSVAAMSAAGEAFDDGDEYGGYRRGDDDGCAEDDGSGRKTEYGLKPGEGGVGCCWR
jgi:hypothetical protein